MKDYVKVNQKVYDRLAREYNERLKDYMISDRKITAPFINYLKDKFDNATILELGPGSGLCLSYFEFEGFQTTAIDISKEILSVSKKNAPKTKYLFGDFLEYDFGTSKFEGIFAKAFIHLFPKKDALFVLRKILGLLTKNGVAFIGTTIHKKSEEGFFEKSDYKEKLKRFRKKWTEKELIEEVEKVGFKILKKAHHSEPDKNKNWINLLLGINTKN